MTFSQHSKDILLVFEQHVVIGCRPALGSRFLKDGRHGCRFITLHLPVIFPGSSLPFDMNGTVAVAMDDYFPFLPFAINGFLRCLRQSPLPTGARLITR